MSDFTAVHSGDKRFHAIIPARGGSKGLPGKNIKLLQNKPLIAYTIEAALNCPYIKRCLVTTEDPAIKEVSLKFGAEVIDRPPELATDSALTRDVVRHVLETLENAEEEIPEDFVLLQPTSPLRNSRHLYDAIYEYLSLRQNCLMSVTEAEHHPYKTLIEDNGFIKPLVDARMMEEPRQRLPRAYRPNGAIYIMNSRLFLDVDSFFVAPVATMIMDAISSVDIDTHLDFDYVSFLLETERVKQ